MMRFSELSALFSEMEYTSSRLKLMEQLGKMLSRTEVGEIRKLVYLCQGIVAPSHEGIELGMGDKLIEQSMALVSGKSVKQIESEYRKTGDLADAGEKILQKKSQQLLSTRSISVSDVYDRLYKISTTSGANSQNAKTKLLAELLSNTEPSEGKTIIRLAQGRLRLGVGDSTLIDALSYSKSGSKDLSGKIERAYNMTSDLGGVAEALFRGGEKALEKIGPAPFSPIRPALAERMSSAKQIIEKLGKCAAEGKYDGFRLQVHKKGRKIKLYSRKQEDLTAMFPDLVEELAKIRGDFIGEGEAIAFNDSTQEFLPFQETIQRRRKHGVEEKARKIPLKMFLFELLCLDGEDFTSKPYSERRAALKKLVSNASDRLELTKSRVIESERDLKAFFDESVSLGLEGVIAKDLNAPYVAGARKFAWIKLKKSYQSGLADSLDLVVVGFYYGKGKRTEFGLGGLLTAAYDPRSRRFKSIARVGTGFTEKLLAELREKLDGLRLKHRHESVDSFVDADAWVRPDLVVTVTADEITRSPLHACSWNPKTKEGLALRFPRLVEVREDKSPEDATTEKEVVGLFESQHPQKSVESDERA